MFDQIDAKRPIRRSWAVPAAIVGAFGLGFEAGGLWFGAKPFDWPSTVLEMLFMAGITVWFGIKAVEGESK